MDSLKESTDFKTATVSSLAGPVLRTFAADKGVQLYDWEEVEALGRLFPCAHRPPRPEDPITICYTSGTTGMPKGAILTHANFVAAMAASEIGHTLTPSDTGISYLPLAHVFGRAMEIFIYSTGGRVGYSTGDPLRILEDVQALQPTFFPTVPRLLNRIYSRVYALTAGAPGLAGTLARRGLAVKMANLKAGLGNKHAFWDRVLFNKVRMVLGGKVERIMTASAPISAEVLSFIRVAFCVEISEAYGQTEGSGGAASTQQGEMEAGHVGPPSPITELKLVDVPELNYFATDKPYPRGEVCVRGPNVFLGYWKDEKKTREMIDEEGWLHSGDIGFIKENGTLTIIDRMKNVFKLSIGEYVAVEKIEYQIASRLPIALQFFVHGNSHQSCLVAIFVPDPESFLDFANKVMSSSSSSNGFTGKVDDDAFRAACRDSRLRRAVLNEVTIAAQSAGLKKFEIPKAVLIDPNPFTIEGDLLTPTFKIKRHPVVQAYRKQLDELYRETYSAADSKL
ncbi:hypothetical protein BGW39_001629 [Mortierella sp. 14UC]|nr:hypothetical protein BGW39_001629 [Mortierella sp. 14UC]